MKGCVGFWDPCENFEKQIKGYRTKTVRKLIQGKWVKNSKFQRGIARKFVSCEIFFCVYDTIS